MDDLKTFLVSYRHEGTQWNVEIKARDFADAKARVGQLALGRVEGEVLAKIPASLGPLAALTAWVRNSVWRLANAR